MIYKLKNKKTGFTLIETLIAILVLMLSITGPLTLAQKGLQATLIAKDQNTAFYLAQDAVEYVRWVRDTNKLASSPSWLAGLNGTSNGHTTGGGSCTTASGCTIDSLKDAVTTCSGTCSALSYDASNNYFTYDSLATPTIFTRTVTITTPIGTNDCTSGHGCEASVIVTVTWKDQGSIPRNVTVQEELFDWE